MKIIDRNPPRFGRVRWWLVRKFLAALNLVEGRFAKVREWALEEAVASSPDFDTSIECSRETFFELVSSVGRASGRRPAKTLRMSAVDGSAAR